MTGQELIASSLRLIGVLASGETPSNAEATDGLTALNDVIESWSNEQLLIPDKVREVFPLVANQRVYTMGIGGNFNTSRAMEIENCLIQLVANSPVLELPMEILNKDQYASILLKTMTSDFPLYMYNDGNYPLDNINIFPVPTSSANNIVLYSWKPLTAIATLTTSLSVPPGYKRALRYALALELSSEYGKTLSDTTIAQAIESKAVIKRTNAKPYYLQVDQAIRATPAVWDWRTGELV